MFQSVNYTAPILQLVPFSAGPSFTWLLWCIFQSINPGLCFCDGLLFCLILVSLFAIILVSEFSVDKHCF